MSSLSTIRLEHLTEEPNADYKFELPEDMAPPAVDDEIRRKKEELQSMQDRGGPPQWTEYSLALASSTTASEPASGPSASPAAAASNLKVPAPYPFVPYPKILSTTKPSSRWLTKTNNR